MAEESGTSSLEKSLTENKIAGVPAWGVGVALAALIVIVLYMRNKKKAVAATPAPTPGTPDTSSGLVADEGAGLPTGPIGDWLKQNPTSGAFPVGGHPQGIPGPITNQQWARLAFDELIAKGDDPTLVENSLAKFISGQPLTAAETAVKNLAEQMFGAPPEGVIPSTPAPSGGTPSGGSGALPSVTNIQITASRNTVNASWDKVPGAVWYETFWRGPRGSTGGNVTMATTASGDLGLMQIKSGERIEILVIPFNGTSTNRGPDATASTVVP